MGWGRQSDCRWGGHLRLRPARPAVGRPLLGHRRVDLGRQRRFAEGADDFERHHLRRDAEHKALRRQQFHLFGRVAGGAIGLGHLAAGPFAYGGRVLWVG